MTHDYFEWLRRNSDRVCLYTWKGLMEGTVEIWRRT